MLFFICVESLIVLALGKELICMNANVQDTLLIRDLFLATGGLRNQKAK